MSLATARRYTLVPLLLFALFPAHGDGSKVPQVFDLLTVIGPGEPEESDPSRNREFGTAISVNGNSALVTMPAFADHKGRVAVFTRVPAREFPRWDRTGTLDPIPGDSFGHDPVFLGRELALVGALSGTYVYRRTGNKLRFLQVLPARGPLAAEGGVAFIGGSEKVSIYAARKDGKLRLVQTLTSGEGVPDIGFGTSLAAWRGTLVVAAPGDDDGRGSVFVFERRGGEKQEGPWVKRQKLQAIAGTSEDGFAHRVAIDDGLIAVSAPQEITTNPDCTNGTDPGIGTIYVFAKGRGLWFQQQKVLGPCVVLGFGEDVALSDGTLVGIAPLIRVNQRAQVILHRQMGKMFVPVVTLEAGGFDSGGLSSFAFSNAILLIGIASDRQDIDPNVAIGHASIYECLPAPTAEAQLLHAGRADPLLGLCAK
jgi:hypothetical protein